MAIYRNIIEDGEGDQANIDGNNNLRVSDIINETILTNAKDPLNSSISIIDSDHYEIHKENHFYYSDYLTLSNAEVVNFVMETGSKEIHLLFSLNSTIAGFTLESYEGITADTNGTLITSLNNKRDSSNISTAAIRKNPTNVSTTGAIRLRNSRNGTTGATAFLNSGNLNRTNEVIFKKNTKYLLKLTNLYTSTNYINIDISWYEL